MKTDAQPCDWVVMDFDSGDLICGRCLAVEKVDLKANSIDAIRTRANDFLRRHKDCGASAAGEGSGKT